VEWRTGVRRLSTAYSASDARDREGLRALVQGGRLWPIMPVKVTMGREALLREGKRRMRSFTKR